MNKRLLKKIEGYKAKVESFNAELRKFYETTGEEELPLIDSTIIGYDALDPYELTDLPDGGFRADADGVEIEVKVVTDEEGEEYVVGWDRGEYPYADTLKESLAYDKRRLAKGWRVWKSENPDVELETDED